MPYIITTLTPHTRFGPLELGNKDLRRRAVATLDEARDAAKRIVEDADYPEGKEAQAAMAGDAARCEALTDSGAVVLPDGTIIEVEHRDWIAMRSLAGRLPVRTHTKPEVLDAYNTAHA